MVEVSENMFSKKRHNPFQPDRIVVTPDVAARLEAICEEEPYMVFHGTPDVPEDNPETFRRLAAKHGFELKERYLDG